MPIYEFKCQSCRQVFDELCHLNETGEKLRCPECGQIGAKRLISVFAAHGLENGHHGIGKTWGKEGESRKGADSPCGSCKADCPAAASA